MAEIKRNIEKALSPVEVRHLYSKMNNEDLNVVLLQNVKSSDTIENLLGKGNCMVLYIPVLSLYNGHYVSICRNKQGIFFFDSYGYNPKQILNIVDGIGKVHDNNLVFKILFDNNQPCYYNSKHFQSQNENVADCGRWAVLNLSIFRQYGDEYNIELFNSVLMDYMKRNNITNNDVAVAKLTNV